MVVLEKTPTPPPGLPAVVASKSDEEWDVVDYPEVEMGRMTMKTRRRSLYQVWEGSGLEAEGDTLAEEERWAMDPPLETLLIRTGVAPRPALVLALGSEVSVVVPMVMMAEGLYLV